MHIVADMAIENWGILRHMNSFGILKLIRINIVVLEADREKKFYRVWYSKMIGES